MSRVRCTVEDEHPDAPRFFNPWELEAAISQTQWGAKSYQLLLPILDFDIEHFDQLVYNIMYHLKQQRSEVLSWPTSEMRRIWRRHLKQMEFEQKEMKKSLDR